MQAPTRKMRFWWAKVRYFQGAKVARSHSGEGPPQGSESASVNKKNGRHPASLPLANADGGEGMQCFSSSWWQQLGPAKPDACTQRCGDINWDCAQLRDPLSQRGKD